MTPSRIGHLLDALTDVHALTQRARHLLALQEQVRAALPAELSASTAVASLKQGQLVLVAENGAAAAKLRHLAPQILRSLAQRDPEVTAIQVRVQVTKRVNPLPLKQKSLGLAGREAFQALARRLPASGLRRAILHVANPRAAASDNQQETFEGEKSQKHQEDE